MIRIKETFNRKIVDTNVIGFLL